jgi:hypothetical protein
LSNWTRLFRETRWLRTKRPSHAFVLSRRRLAYVGPEGASKGAAGVPASIRVVTRALPADALAEGVAGLPVAGAAYAGAVARLLAEVAVRMPAASLVVADDFVRVLVIDAVDPEENPKEVEEVLAWKFGRTFGEPAPPLRLSWQASGPGESDTRVVALAAPEEAVASWEAPFEKAGIRLGALEIESLAVSSLGLSALGGDGLVVWAPGPTATVVHFEKGSLRFVRVRSTADAFSALQELQMTASYVSPRGTAAPGGTETALADGESPVVRMPCAAGPAGAPLVEMLSGFRREHGGPPPSLLSPEALVPGLRAASGVDEATVLAALGAMAGGD